MTLSLQQVEQIRISFQNINLASLREDLLDHLCCTVEYKLEKGKSFEEAMREAVMELAPYGLTEIQEKTIALLNNRTIVHMKKVMYATGLATTMSMAMGLRMKLLHMPGGEQLTNYGFLGFCLLFLPVLAVMYYDKNRSMTRHEKLKMLFGYSSAMITGLAIIFKMQMRLDSSETLLIIGTSFLVLVFFRSCSSVCIKNQQRLCIKLTLS